ncbi:MAG: DMT family transporter [Paracoccaceae bacterium]
MKDNLALGLWAILVTCAGLSLGDALIKGMSTGFVLWQVFALRSLIALPVLLLVAAVRGRTGALLPVAPGWTGLRSLLLVVMWLVYYISLPHLQFSAAAAALYTIPIFMTLFSALLLKAPVGLGGWIAVVLGFAGVLAILQPSREGFNLYALLPLLSAVLYVLAMILTRTKCNDEDPLALSFALNLAMLASGFLVTGALWLAPIAERSGFLLGPWATMGGAEWMSMAFLAAMTLVGSIGAAIAYQNGPPAVIGVFDISYVGFAVLWDLVLFAQMPGRFAVIGMVQIVAGGILSVRTAARGANTRTGDARP